MNAGGHIGELALRRRHAGEALGDQAAAIEAHVETCADCRTRLRALDDEQRRFEDEISFDRFAAGVERAARGTSPPRRARPRFWVTVPALAAAAAVALVATFRDPARPPESGNRIKGGAGITVRVAGATGQRTARLDAPEPLAAGDRLRIGYVGGEHRYLLSLSIDDRGAVTPLYPEQGASLPVPPDARPVTRYLPDSLELTGAGTETIVVLLSDQPIDVEAARQAARAAFDHAGGDLARLPGLGLPGEEFRRTFAKP